MSLEIFIFAKISAEVGKEIKCMMKEKDKYISGWRTRKKLLVRQPLSTL